MGIYEGQDAEMAWRAIHEEDEVNGINSRPKPNNDGTPSESVADVLVRGNQLVSTIESMYSGENVLIVAPDSDNLSILTAALTNEHPDDILPHHATFSFANGEVRKLVPLVKPSELLVTGQTVEEAKANSRRMQALRLASLRSKVKDSPDTWLDLWHLSIDSS